MPDSISVPLAADGARAAAACFSPAADDARFGPSAAAAAAAASAAVLGETVEYIDKNQSVFSLSSTFRRF